MRHALFALLLAGCDLVSMKWSSDVTFDIDKHDVHVGDEIEVRFSVRKEDGRHWWIALVPEDLPFTDPRGRRPIPKGAKVVHLTAANECRCEVRVFHDPNGQAVMVARRKVNVRE